MRIQKVTSGSVIIEVDPGQCLLLAEACRHASDAIGEESSRDDAQYRAVAAHFEALALLGAIGHYSFKVDKLLADWTLPVVRREWGHVITNQPVAAEEVAK